VRRAVLEIPLSLPVKLTEAIDELRDRELAAHLPGRDRDRALVIEPVFSGSNGSPRTRSLPVWQVVYRAARSKGRVVHS
jgi:hypothetical protein